MQKIKNYFEEEKQNTTPSRDDFAVLLSKIEVKPRYVPARRSPFMFWSFASVSFAALVLLVVSVVPGNNNETLPQAATMKVAVNQPNEKVETLNTLDSVQSFNIKNDNDF